MSMLLFHACAFICSIYVVRVCVVVCMIMECTCFAYDSCCVALFVQVFVALLVWQHCGAPAPHCQSFILIIIIMIIIITIIPEILVLILVTLIIIRLIIILIIVTITIATIAAAQWRACTARRA